MFEAYGFVCLFYTVDIVLLIKNQISQKDLCHTPRNEMGNERIVPPPLCSK